MQKLFVEELIKSNGAAEFIEYCFKNLDNQTLRQITSSMYAELIAFNKTEQEIFSMLIAMQNNIKISDGFK